MQKILLVALGGMFGAVLRYLLTDFSSARFGINFPYGILLVNVVGCFFAGIIMGAIAEKGLLSENIRLLLVIGFAGGLTTFSSFSVDTVNLLQQQQYMFSVANIFLNIFLSLVATFLGLNLVRLL